MLGYIPLIACVLIYAIQLDKCVKFIEEQADTIRKLKPF